MILMHNRNHIFIYPVDICQVNISIEIIFKYEWTIVHRFAIVD